MKAGVVAVLVAIVSFMIPGCENVSNNTYTMVAKGNLVKHSGCKGKGSGNGLLKTSDNQTCAQYVYLPESNKLIISHINAAFNCVPDSIYCIISGSGSSLIIEEFEKDHLARCLCLYDLNIEITGIEPKVYQVQIVEPYIGNQQTLGFEIDLSKIREGEHCVPRSVYPWGF